MKRSLLIAMITSLLSISIFAMPGRQIGGTDFEKRPIIAQHPACPLFIEGVSNVDVTQKYFWQNATVTVRNISPEPVLKAHVDLRFIGPRYTQVVSFSSKTPIFPKQTGVLTCTLFQELNEAVQKEFEQAAKVYFVVDSAEFVNYQWFTDRFWSYSGTTPAGDRLLQSNEVLTNRLLADMKIPQNWQESTQFTLYSNAVSRDNTRYSTGGGSCGYQPMNTSTEVRCFPCRETLRKTPLEPCLGGQTGKGCYRVEASQVPCGACLTPNLIFTSCGSPIGS